MSQQPDRAVDGRHLRRERGRRAVVDAMIDLVLDDQAPPSVGQLADRAGVSQASVFRYFRTLDDLRHEAIGRYFERFDHLIAIPEIGEGPLPHRIDRLVRTRLAFYDATAPMARLARRQAVDVPELGETLGRVRATFIDQIAQHFALELARLPAAARNQRVTVLAALTSFESWDQLVAAGLDAAGRHTALVGAITHLVEPVS